MSDTAAVLFDAPPDRPTCTDLVPVDTSRCPNCDGPTRVLVVHEPPLLRHGGYGAARKTLRVLCTARCCDWRLVREVSEVKP